MAKIDEKLELLISRQLDGELSADEELELNKMLIRSPAARALMEEYERNDHLAKMALRSALSPEEFRPLLLAESSLGRRGGRRWVWVGLSSMAAVAAAVALVLLGPTVADLMRGTGSGQPGLETVASRSEPVEGTVAVDNPLDGSAPGRRLEPVGPRMPFAPTQRTVRQVERYVVPMIEGDPAKQDVVPLWQFERRRESIRTASGDL